MDTGLTVSEVEPAADSIMRKYGDDDVYDYESVSGMYIKYGIWYLLCMIRQTGVD